MLSCLPSNQTTWVDISNIYDVIPLQGAWEAWKETPCSTETILADLGSQDHDTTINAERTLLVMELNQEAP